jgi:hypothetical protein
MEEDPMKRSFVLVVIVVTAALLAAPAWNFQEKRPIAAYIIKVVKDVERRVGSTSGWSKALLLSELKAGYEVRTQDKSFAMIKFPDESKVAVREKSIITLQGEVSGNKILRREVYIERGRAVFNIKKQDTEQFRFTSPISVASIRGTEGGTGFDPATSIADLTLITGEAMFSSTRNSSCSVTVSAGHTGIVDSTGTGCRVELASPGALLNNNPDSPLNQGNFGGGTGGTGQLTTSTSFALNTSLTGALSTGQGVALRISMSNPPVSITQALMRYRNQGDPSYKTLSLTISGLNLSGIIPGSDIKAGVNKTFEYYFSMMGSNGTKYSFPENTPEADPYTLPIKPKVVYIKIPITTPTGESRFLQISCEE